MKSSLGLLGFAAIAVVMGACGTKPNSDSPCKTGAAACRCYANDTCDDGLTCLATLCLDLSGVAGTGSGLGSAGETATSDAGAAGAADAPSDSGGASATGGSGGAATNTGGSSHGGGAVSMGGAISTGGSGGSGNVFPPDPAGCARVTTCPTCCETAGVFALDSLALDATSRYVTAFDVTASAVTAEFAFATSDEVGAIFFHFSTPQDIGALSISGVATGGAFEIALVRSAGQDGCIYPVVAGELASIPASCWGLGAGPYAALPADQIEVRVRSLGSGRAALNVSSVQYGP
ncbi:MAG: hypothetical protein ABW061_16510 [Polyangiaceae bacterium]